MAFQIKSHGVKMTLREFLASQKSIKKIGKWSDKKMPKTGNGFPLSKARNFRLGSGWHWNIVEIEAGNLEWRLLVAYQPNKENYQAVLGYVLGADMHVVASLEYHGTHPGWHIHGACRSANSADVGRLRYPDMRRLPDGKKYHRKTAFDVTEADAMRPAIDYFRLNDALNAMSNSLF
jgi:hypothetical protein